VVPVQRGDDEAEPEPAPPSGQQRAGTGSRAGRTPVGLTERELQVLLGMAEGKSNAEIGRELFVSEDTVKTHARRLFRKLGARDRAHAVAAGFRAGLVA
ncbi:MAG: response regulator transcription factor, partial [Micromonospora sp.]